MDKGSSSKPGAGLDPPLSLPLSPEVGWALGCPRPQGRPWESSDGRGEGIDAVVPNGPNVPQDRARGAMEALEPTGLRRGGGARPRRKGEAGPTPRRLIGASELKPRCRTRINGAFSAGNLFMLRGPELLLVVVRLLVNRIYMLLRKYIK